MQKNNYDIVYLLILSAGILGECMEDYGNLAWLLFFGFVLVMLVVDLKLAHSKSHVIGMREATIWSIIWIASALIFCLLIYFWRGSEPAFSFLAGYLVEKMLSVDNLFVFLLIFKYFHVPSNYLHKVLFWGIFGALVMRALFITVGLELIHHFDWILYVFGAFLIYSGIVLFMQKDKKLDLEGNLVLRLAKKILPITKTFEGDKFFVKVGMKWFVTPLFLVLLIVEATDIVFAVDSIPAIFAITLDPFIVYTSNIFAILGLRALYFVLAGFMELFHYLHYGLSLILVYIGVKMLLIDFIKVPVWATLSVILGVLSVTVIASLLYPSQKSKSNL